MHSSLMSSVGFRPEVTYSAALVLVPAAANTSVASCSAMGMKVCTTSASNSVLQLSSKRRIASA